MTATATMLPGFQGELFAERRGNSYATSAALAYVLTTDGVKGVTELDVMEWRKMPGFVENGDVRTEGQIIDHAELVKRWAANEGLI